MNDSFSIEQCLKVCQSPYELVLLSKCRARELALGAAPLVGRSDLSEKSHNLALREIAESHHDYYSLHEKLLSSIRNSMLGVTEDIFDSPGNDKFNEEIFFSRLCDATDTLEGRGVKKDGTTHSSFDDEELIGVESSEEDQGGEEPL